MFKKWRLQRELDVRVLESKLKLLEALPNVPIDKSEPGWTVVSSAGSSSRKEDEFTAYDLETLQKEALKFYYQNPIARQIIRIYVSYTFGKDVQFRSIEEDEEKNKELMSLWKKWREENFSSAKLKEMGIRCFRDGESFIRIFKKGEAGEFKLRFISPENISNPSGQISWGIETDPNDVETPLFYYYVLNGVLKEKIPADEIIHIKINVDSDVKRGRSVLEPIMKWNKKYEQWLDDRIILNKIRNSVALIKHIGQTSAVSTIVDNQKTNSGGITGKQDMFKPGSVFTATDNVKYEMLAPNVEARDTAVDGRNILLYIAAGVGLAEFIMTMDASNANYSSTMIAQNPTIMMFTDYREFFSTYLKKIFKTFVTNLIEDGLIDEDISTDCEITYPTIIIEDVLKEVQALEVLMNNGAVSRQTACEKAGYVWNDEQARIENEDSKLLKKMENK